MYLGLQLLGGWVVHLEALEVVTQIDPIVVVKVALLDVEGIVLVHVA